MHIFTVFPCSFRHLFLYLQIYLLKKSLVNLVSISFTNKYSFIETMAFFEALGLHLRKMFVSVFVSNLHFFDVWVFLENFFKKNSSKKNCFTKNHQKSGWDGKSWIFKTHPQSHHLPRFAYPKLRTTGTKPCVAVSTSSRLAEGR